jgi:hypothetical protein
MKHAIIADTMVYLHYIPVDQVDWHTVLNVPSSDDVLIVVPGITLREIDKHKNTSPRLRNRAQRAGSQLGGWLSSAGSVLRDGVRIEAALRAPQVNWLELGLDSASNDDMLVASVVEFSGARRDCHVVLVTQDNYVRLRASALGIDVLSLGDEFRLPSDDDPVERENRELRRELQRMQAIRPVLDLQFAGSAGKTMRVVIRAVAPLSSEEMAERLKEIEQRYLPVESFMQTAKPLREGTASADQARQGVASKLAAFLAAQDRADSAELARYAEERAAFLVKYAKYLHEARAHERARARRFALELELVNTGSAPAQDIDVHLHIPDGVLVVGSDDLKEPKAPDPPTRPRNAMELLRDSMASSVYTPPMYRSLGALDEVVAVDRSPNVSPLEIEETHSFDIRFHVGAVKHGLPVRISPIPIAVPDGAEIRPFQIPYTLRPANLPDPVRNVLSVILTAE